MQVIGCSAMWDIKTSRSSTTGCLEQGPSVGATRLVRIVGGAAFSSHRETRPTRGPCQV